MAQKKSVRCSTLALELGYDQWARRMGNELELLVFSREKGSLCCLEPISMTLVQKRSSH